MRQFRFFFFFQIIQLIKSKSGSWLWTFYETKLRNYFFHCPEEARKLRMSVNFWIELRTYFHKQIKKKKHARKSILTWIRLFLRNFLLFLFRKISHIAPIEIKCPIMESIGHLAHSLDAKFPKPTVLEHTAQCTQRALRRHRIINISN